MTDSRRGYAELQDVILDPSFPELDLALRRGRHVDREDLAWYTLLTEGQEHLEAFYRRYGCELIHKSDGYFYLLPTGEKLSRRQLGAGDMLVGQALALLYLDPAMIERGGRATHEDVIAQLVVVLGSDALIRAFNPHKKRKLDERVAQKNVRARIGEAIRHLAALGFVDELEDAQLLLRPALLRFADAVRGAAAPAEALARLVATGEVALVTEAQAEAAAVGGEGEDGGAEDGEGEGDDADEDPEAAFEGAEAAIQGADAVIREADAAVREAEAAIRHADAHGAAAALEDADAGAEPEDPEDDPPYVFEDDAPPDDDDDQDDPP